MTNGKHGPPKKSGQQKPAGKRKPRARPAKASASKGDAGTSHAAPGNKVSD